MTQNEAVSHDKVIFLAEKEAPAQTSARSVLSRSQGPGRKSFLGYPPLNPEELGTRLNVPRSWVLRNSNPQLCKDAIPCLPLGKYKRFLWNSPELRAWIERHVVCPYPVDFDSAQPEVEYEYLDSGQFAARLRVAESWVRDQVRSRAYEPIPHVRFGKYVRFRLGSPELEIWAERRMLSANIRAVVRAHGKETIQ